MRHSFPKSVFVVLLALLPVALLERSSVQRADVEVGGRSMVERERDEKAARERASGSERPGETPREAITGSRSGSSLGRAENPWDTRGRPLRGDEWD